MVVVTNTALKGASIIELMRSIVVAVRVAPIDTSSS
jgi:hypothetical protein